MASKQRPLGLSEFCKTSFHAAASPDFTAVYMPSGSRIPPEQAFERCPLGTLETYRRVRQQIRHSVRHENFPKGCLAPFRTTGKTNRSLYNRRQHANATGDVSRRCPCRVLDDNTVVMTARGQPHCLTSTSQPLAFFVERVFSLLTTLNSRTSGFPCKQKDSIFTLLLIL